MAGKKKKTTKKETGLNGSSGKTLNITDPLVDEMKSQLISAHESIAKLTDLIDKMHTKQIELEKIMDRLRTRMGL